MDARLKEYVDPAKLDKMLTIFINNSVRQYSPRGDKETRMRAKAELQKELEFEAER